MKNFVYLFLLVAFSQGVYALPFTGAHASWIQDQIEEDLRPFRGRIFKKSELLEELEKDRSGVILVEIQDNRVQLVGSASEISCGRARVVRDFFNRLLAERQLPNVSFLINLHDACKNACRVEALPIFGFAKPKSACAILLPDSEALESNDALYAEYEDYCLQYPWEVKKEILFWRGATTGEVFTLENYKSAPRIQFVMLGDAFPWLDAGLVGLSQGADKIAELHAYQKPHVTTKKHFAYKYLIDIDGNSCTYSRCRWILLSNSVLFKHESENVQWYYKAIKPYEHYIPVKEDWSNLESQYEWLKAHDHEAKRVALAGQQLGKTIFSDAAIGDYVEKLLIAYADIYSNE